MFSKFFIERPIFASVISVVIVIAGVVSFGALPIAQYPEITPPTVEVSAAYPGANARVFPQTRTGPRGRLKPPTVGLGIRRSIRLSYRGV